MHLVSGSSLWPSATAVRNLDSSSLTATRAQERRDRTTTKVAHIGTGGRARLLAANKAEVRSELDLGREGNNNGFEGAGLGLRQRRSRGGWHVQEAEVAKGTPSCRARSTQRTWFEGTGRMRIWTLHPYPGGRVWTTTGAEVVCRGTTSGRTHGADCAGRRWLSRPGRTEAGAVYITILIDSIDFQTFY
jgi:hypothetical protein